jgi:ribosome-associated translation inhibitor RaiA
VPTLAAAVVGVSAQTLRRWAAAARSGCPLLRRHGPARAAPDPVLAAKAVEIIHALGGMVGAESLGRSTGLSRRQAATVKADELTAMERERKAACTHVVVSAPGIVRGFDQIYVWTEEGWRFPLVSADGAVPYRTSILVAEAYDEDAVYAALENDIDRNGAPLVWRRDRFSAHRTDRIAQLLDSHGILALQGPAHYPRFYGQLERQNREHRAWLGRLGVLRAPSLQPACDRMLVALNDTWRRRSLGWRTATEAWSARRSPSQPQRDSFRQEVYDRAARIERRLDHDNDLAMRLAIEQALQQRGYLRLERGVGAN